MLGRDPLTAPDPSRSITSPGLCRYGRRQPGCKAMMGRYKKRAGNERSSSDGTGRAGMIDLEGAAAARSHFCNMPDRAVSDPVLLGALGGSKEKRGSSPSQRLTEPCVREIPEVSGPPRIDAGRQLVCRGRIHWAQRSSAGALPTTHSASIGNPARA